MQVKRTLTAFTAATLLFTGAAAFGQEPSTKKADNTGVNERDRSKQEPTADQQKENKPDRTLAKEIRRAIVGDKSLSTYAHNVKVIVDHGTVTLKGPVRSQDERAAVEAKASQIAGAGNVKNELSIAGEKDADRAKTKGPDEPKKQ
jgi:hyperosmotically inducible periplasmic protein